MEVKKYIAGNMQEAIAKIKTEMGADAIIISTRKVRQGKGVFGMFGKEVLEVTATSPKKDENLIDNFDTKKTVESAKKQNMNGVKNQYGFSPVAPYNEEDNSELQEGKLTELLLEPLKLEIDEVKSMIDEINEMLVDEKSAIDSIMHLRQEIHELKGLINIHLNNEHAIPFKNLHTNLASVYQQLIVNGVEERFIKRLIEEARFKITQQNIDNAHYVKLYMARMIMQLIKVTDIFAEDTSKDKRIYSLIGSTGVGKTSTIAKLAGLIKQKNPKAEIGIITTDTIRMGTTELLKDFSKSVRAKFRICGDSEDIKKAVRDFRDRDYILIDNAGIAQRDTHSIQALKELLSPVGQINNLLVLNATTKDNDINEQTKRFGDLNPVGIVFTKFDESTYYGNILNHLIRFKIPLFFITMGQKVPDDIEVAVKERIIDLIMNFSETE